MLPKTLESPAAPAFVRPAALMGIGIDCEECPRFKEIAADPLVLDRIYTARELEAHRGSANYHQHLAGKFAAKEAVIKSLAGCGAPLVLSSIEIDNRPDGSPVVNLLDERARGLYGVSVSISHTEQVAVAVALAYAL